MGKRHRTFQPHHEAVLEKTKVQICEAIRHSALRKYWHHKDLALLLGTSESCVSRVLRCRVENLTINQLFRYLVILEPDFQILISI